MFFHFNCGNDWTLECGGRFCSDSCSRCSCLFFILFSVCFVGILSSNRRGDGFVFDELRFKLPALSLIFLDFMAYLWLLGLQRTILRRIDAASILDVEELEAGSGAMRDVIKLDELPEGLLAAMCRWSLASWGQWFRFGWLPRWATLVQGPWPPHQWRIFNGCCSSQQFTWGSESAWVWSLELAWVWTLWNLCRNIRWPWWPRDIAIHMW